MIIHYFVLAVHFHLLQLMIQQIHHSHMLMLNDNSKLCRLTHPIVQKYIQPQKQFNPYLLGVSTLSNSNILTFMVKLMRIHTAVMVMA